MNHLPVMYQEVLSGLNIQSEGCYIDCTFGRGGHSLGILQQLTTGRLIAFDQDQQATHSNQARALSQDQRFHLTHSRFSELESQLIQQFNIQQVDGILLDLGLSSPQLDQPERGFSFSKEGELDMRMNQTIGMTAAQWLASVSETELTRILFEYGEERYAKRIANAIIEIRQQQPISKTSELVKIICAAIPKKETHKHPATRSFQAIRIALNNELNELIKVLPQTIRLLKPQGRLVVISFHSLEDRIVKQFIHAESGAKYDPGKLPIKQADIAQGCLKKIGKAIRATEAEIQMNPRARSAILRIAEKSK